MSIPNSIVGEQKVLPAHHCGTFPPGTPVVDSDSRRCYKACDMLRLAKVGLAIVIVVSVASILITPNPSDDVDGALQGHHLAKVAVVRFSASQSQYFPPVTLEFVLIAFQCSALSNLLDLACVRRC